MHSNRTVRSKKVAFVQESYTNYGTRVEIVALDDLINGNYSPALKGRTSAKVQTPGLT